MLRFMATPVKQKDIKAGDLLSTQGLEHWGKAHLHKCSCEWKHPVIARLMIAMNEEPESNVEDSDDIYRITLYTDEEEDADAQALDASEQEANRY